MKFEEQFPELKDNHFSTINLGNPEQDKTYEQTLIQQHCLSKTRVREVIEKINNNLKENSCIVDVNIGYAVIRDLLKEFGLTKEDGK